MPFDPNAFLQKYGTPAEGEPTSTGFDPNAFLKKYGSDNAAPATTGFDPNSFLKKYGGEQAASEQPTFIDARGQKPPEPKPEDQSFLRSVADVPLNITQGGVSGIRMIADAFGADSSTSKTLRGVEDYLGGLMSAQSKQDKQEISRILKEAEDKGVGDQVLAGLKALSVAPVDTVSNALGTSAPAIIGGLGALVFGAPVAAATATAVGIGSAMGAGTVKSAIYDATKEELTKLKLPPDEVERRAEAAQAYGGKNLDQIAIGTALGGLTAFGFETATLKNVASNIVGKVAAAEAAESAVAKGVGRRVGEHVVKEAVPEGIQGSQEQLAQNLALQREGVDTPTMRGVISQGVLEAGASAPLGAYAGLRDKQQTPDTTGAGNALRGLDELAAREEAETTEEVTVPGTSVTKNEAKGLLNNLTKQLGREPSEQEFEDAYNDYISQRTGTGTGTSVASTTDTSSATPDTSTGIPPSSEGTGLGVPNTTATGTGISETGEPSTLETPTNEQRNVATYLDGLPQDMKRYETYINHESVGPMLKYADATIQRLTAFINERGFTVNEVNGANPDSAAKEAKSLSSQLAGSVSRLLTKQDGVDRELKRANPEQLEKSKVEVDTLLNEIDSFINKQSAPSKPITLNAKSEEDKLPRVDSIPKFAFGPTSIKPTVVAEDKPLYRETNVDGLNDLLRANSQFEFSGAFVTDNPDLALGQGNNKGVQVEFRPNSVSGEENKKPMTGDLAGREFKSNVIAPRAVQSVTFTKAKDFNRTNGIAKRALIAEFDRSENADGGITFTRKAEPSNKPSVSNAPAMSMEEGEKALDAQFTNVAETNMAPFIVEMINQNDINGALRAIASRTRGFYGELAARLAELNLSTGIYVGRQSAVLQQLINSEVGPQMEQIAQYMQAMFPNSMLTYTIKKHLNGDESGKNIADVYSALIDIESGTPNLNGDVLTKEEIAPILPQLNDALRVYKDVEDSLNAPGFYIQRFNILNINPNVRDGMTYRTFLHETIHAATQSLLDADSEELTEEQIETREELKKLFAIASLKGPIGEYGLTNIHEFVAELFTNAHFRNQLKKIPYPPARTNMLTKFISAIMKLVGMDNLAGRSMVVAEKLFTSQRYTPTSSFKINMANKTGPRKRGPISTIWRVVEDMMESVKDWENIKQDLIPAMWDAGNGVFRNVMLGVMNLRQIADVTKTKFPQIDTSIRTIEKMLAYRGKIMNEGGDIIQRWTKAQSKNTKGSQLLGRVMLEATIRGLEVDPKSSNYNVSKINKEMMDAWNALGPDFQQIYRDVRDFYKRAVEETIRLMKERANSVTDPEKRKQLLADIDAQFGPDKLKGPYFPLRRFGEFWFQVGEGNFKEFYTFESRLARNRAMAARKRELSKGNAQQRGLVDSIHSGNGMSELYGQNLANTQILQDVQKIIDSVGDTVIDKTTGVSRDKSNAEVKDELKDSLNQLIYVLLPQQSMRKMFINRKAIQGASGDMLRVFATHAVHSAYQRSRFKFAQEFMDNLTNAHNWVREFAKGKDYEVYRDYINEVEKRSKTILGTEDTSLTAKIAGKASEATFFFMLSSPFTAMLNTIGFAQVAMPYIGGRYGYANTNKRILENMGKYLKTAPTRTFSPLAKGHMSQVSFPSIVEGGGLTGILKDAAQQLLDEEQINISLTNDVFDIGSRPSATYTGKVNAVKRAVAGLFHQSERLNREITLLSVVELAYEKLMSEPIKNAKGIIQRDAQGQPMRYTDNATTSDGSTKYSKEAFELAVNEAKDIAGLALGDFTRQMKPRYFTPPLLSVLTKFKQYSVLASYAIIRNAQLGLLKPFSTKELDALRQQLEEQYKTAVDKDAIVKQQMEEAQTQQKEIAKEARRRLAGILGMTYLFGGYAAMPFFSLLTPILVGMLAGEDDDDDEFFNWENWFKNYMESEFGGSVGAMLQKFGVEETTAKKAGRKVGETLVYGPASTVTGGALSDRVSLDLKNLWYRDGRYSPDTRESVVEHVIANAGPVVGLTVNAMDAWDMAQNGQIGRAFEKMAPALFAKPVTAARLATEGGKTKGGDTLVDEFTTAELAIQAVGLQPLRLSQAQKASIETVQKAQKITNKHDSIMNRLWMERDNGEAFNDALEDAIKFSEQHPGYAITAKKIKESFEKRAKDSAMAGVFGARIPKPLQGELMDMPDYGKE
jgi:hypothetical protein